MTYYILVKSDSTIISDYNGEGLTNKQKAVGGLIELVALEEGMTAYVNEQGLLNSLPKNPLATIQFRNANVFDTYLFENQEVLGNVLFRCESEQQYKLLEASLKLAKQVSILEQSMEDSDVR
jgi:hypothetical protein